MSHMNDTEEVTCKFRRTFESLTSNPPLTWQVRLFRDHLAKNELPPVIDLPTGLGKTMVMAIWLIARSEKDSKLPRRLIYVVDRRTVVDQATELAMTLQDRFGKEKLTISTLRGQLADNREWSRDPSKLAIIIGTVDLIGSALLFSGYRSSYKRRPLEAGLLGQDSLLVLDEAHLSKPFEKLIRAIGDDGPFQKNRDANAQGKPMRVIRMSATSGDSTDPKPPFTLQFDANGTGEDAKDATITDRFGAAKRLTIIPLGEKEKLVDRLAQDAIELVAPSKPEQKPVVGQRIVVFTRRPDDARSIADAIRKHGAKRDSPGPYAEAVEVLTGTMRGLERDQLIEKPVFKERWLNGDLKPDDPTNQSPVFLITTSAGEVGFDLNADHLVCDATTIDSLIQRLGRVNRRGMGDAQVHLFVEPPKKEKDGKPKKLEGLDLAIANTIGLLNEITTVSPKNIAHVKRTAWSTIPDEEQSKEEPKSRYDLACSPVPTVVELTDILLDAWSMTSLTEPMPGRPEVGPWLRGIADELPQTTIAWRAELDVDGFADLDPDDIEEWFDTHRILTYETLSVPTNVAAKWFIDRWANLPESLQSRIAERPVVVDRAGITVIPLKRLIDELSRKGAESAAAIRYANVILPASFGGIERRIGLLDADAPTIPKDEDKLVAEERQQAARERLLAPDVADVRGRYREIVIKNEEGKSEPRPLGNGTKPPRFSRLSLTLESEDDKTVQVISYVPRREMPEWGAKKQTLAEHVGLVRHRMNELLDRLDLSETIRMAAQLAADWHDHGKNRERWQRSIGGTAAIGTTAWLTQLTLEGDGTLQCLGKSGGAMKRDPRGYRHEFGSLREFTDAFNSDKLPDDVFDLAMHLIATHHGRGRPHFSRGAFDPDCERRSDEIHTDAIRRFARLQRKYGWWHLAWLENLLRCADALASADRNGEDDPAGSQGDKP